MRHTLIWVVIYVGYSIILSIQGDLIAVMLFNIVNVALYMMAYYSLRYIQIPYLYDKNRKGLFVVSLFFSAICLYVVFRFGMHCLDGVRGMSDKIGYDLAADILVKVIRFYSPAMVLLGFESYYKGKKEQERIRKLEKEKLANELKFLKAQINPQFLFNTLNNLHSYVLHESPKAPDMILGLSRILDYVLYQSQQKHVPLSEELTAIENFLKLEEIRLEENLTLDYKVEGDVSISISPLILLSVIENTFKDVVKNEKGMETKVYIFEKVKNIHCHIFHTSKNPIDLDSKIGVGWTNIRRQLDLVYPNNHDFTIQQEEYGFELKLIIKPIV